MSPGSSRDTARISPTAHYTGYVWARNGLADPAFVTREGRVLHAALRPAMGALGLTGRTTLDDYLLARHQLIDQLLDEAIEQNQVSQVIEIAAGLSPRGWRFTRRHGDGLTYIEADLPAMARHKRRILDHAATSGAGHRVVEIDALRESGPLSVAELAGSLDPSRGLVIITEGLLTYFDRPAVTAMWSRFARVMRPFSHGVYLADLHTGAPPSGLVRVGAVLLSAFVRGQVHRHFASQDEASAALHETGFASARVLDPAALGRSRTLSAGRIEIIHAALS